MSSLVQQTNMAPMSLVGGSTHLPSKYKKAVKDAGNQAVVVAAELEAAAFVAHAAAVLHVSLTMEADQLSEMCPNAEPGLRLIGEGFVQGAAMTVHRMSR